MARGWESKSVESQIETARSEKAASTRKPSDQESAETRRKKETLLLARARILEQIHASLNPRHREMMENALADLEKLLAQYH
jgi:molecular chaperone DnaK (HSP70)